MPVFYRKLKQLSFSSYFTERNTVNALKSPSTGEKGLALKQLKTKFDLPHTNHKYERKKYVTTDIELF